MSRGSTALTAQRSESMILGFGSETGENVKIELPSRRECNFRGSGAFDIEFFGRFWGSKISVEKRTRPRCLKIWFWAPWGRPGRVQGRK